MKIAVAQINTTVGDFAGNAARIRDALLAQNIRVALGEPMSRFPEAKSILKDTLRIAIPDPESEVSFLEVLRKALP